MACAFSVNNEAKAKLINYTEYNPFSEQNTSHTTLYQLSYQGNSAGRGSNLPHITTQANLKPLCYAVYFYSVCEW